MLKCQILLLFFNYFGVVCLFSDAFQYSESNGTNGCDEMEMVFLKGILDNPAVTQKFKVSFNKQCT